MCKKSKKLLLITGLMLVCLSLPSLQLQSATLYTTVPESEQTIVMSKPQYERLKQIISRQDSRLTQLQQKLNMLKKNSTMESKELTESQKQLTKLRGELTLTQKSLTTATKSLKQAEETLQRQEISLNLLTKQIKQMEHKQNVLRRQRDVYAGLLALSVGAVIARG